MSSEKIPVFKDEKGNVFEVPVDGSLGLLAMGHIGIEAWRNKRKEVGFDPVKNKLEMIKEYEEKKGKDQKPSTEHK